jgi:hypothetical protein
MMMPQECMLRWLGIFLVACRILAPLDHAIAFAVAHGVLAKWSNSSL